MSNKEAKQQFANTKNIVWVILSASMAILVSVLLFFPEQLGAGITSVFSLMLWWGLFGLFLFRYMSKRGTYGFIAGSIIGMLLHIFAPVLLALAA